MSQNLNAGSDVMQIGTFRLGQQLFGIDLLKMREIIRPVEITRIPQAEDFVEGVINLRGAVIPVINMRKRFKMPPLPNNKETRIINIEIEDLVVGFLVDAIGQVYRLPINSIEPSPAVMASVNTEYIKGIANTEEFMLVILDTEQLISIETLQQLAAL